MKRPTSWNIKAILVGFVAEFFGAIIVAVVIFIPVASIMSARGASEEQIEHVLWVQLPFLLCWLVLYSLLAVFGGFVAAHIAGHDEMWHAAAKGALIIAVGIASFFLLPDDKSPAWFDALSSMLVLPCSILGGYLRSKWPRRESPQAPTHPPIPEP